MKKSPIFPKSEIGDNNGHEFDPQVDFSQFLVEARNHASKMKIQSPSPYPDEVGKGISSQEKKSKKSWKKSLFSWWKVDKKNKPSMGPSSDPHIANSRRGTVSGPIYGGQGQEYSTRLDGRPNSGPLTGLYTTTKRGGVEMPYVCLDQLNHPNGSHLYGPVYLVT